MTFLGWIPYSDAKLFVFSSKLSFTSTHCYHYCSSQGSPLLFLVKVLSLSNVILLSTTGESPNSPNCPGDCLSGNFQAILFDSNYKIHSIAPDLIPLPGSCLKLKQTIGNLGVIFHSKVNKNTIYLHHTKTVHYPVCGIV